MSGGKCWKCGQVVDNPQRYCPHCGAGFATDDMHYQADGRTLSSEDKDAYLTSPPPKYKRGIGKYVAIGAIVAVGVLLLMGIAGMGHTDAEYDWDFGSIGTYDPQQGTSYVQVIVGIENVGNDAIDLSKINANLKINGHSYTPRNGMSGWLYEDKYQQTTLLFIIPTSEKSAKMDVSIHSSQYSLKQVKMFF